MAVLEDHPGPCFGCILYHLGCDGSLPLAEGNGLYLIPSHSPVIGKFQEAGHGVGSGREDKDQRGTAVGVGEAPRQVESRWLYVIPSHVLYDKVLDGRYHLVRPETAEDDSSRQTVEGIPRAGVRALIRRGRVIDCLPVINV